MMIDDMEQPELPTANRRGLTTPAEAPLVRRDNNSIVVLIMKTQPFAGHLLE
jgi:hypothetical protein